MASKGVPVVLAVEVKTAWPAAIAGRPATADRRHGDGESYVGRGTNCVRTLVETWHSRVSSDREALHAHLWWTSHRRAVAAVEHLCAQSRPRHLGVRLLRVGHGHVPVVYVFVVLDVGTRRIVHWNATEHPTAEWTIQQFRMVVSGDEPHRGLSDHDSIYADSVDRTMLAMGLKVLKTPVRSPQANAFCERDRHDPA